MFLITTPDSKSHNKKFKDIIFLGYGCIKENKLINSKNINYKINSHLWLNPYKMYEDSEQVEIIYEKILNQLHYRLNKVHDISWSKDQWRILIGPWLNKLTYVVYERWYSIEKVYRENKIISTSIYFKDPLNLYTSSREDLSEKIKGNLWNKILFDNIIKFKKKEFYYSSECDFINSKVKHDRKISFSIKKIIKKIIYFPLLINLLRFLKRNDNIAFVNSYISNTNILKLKVKNKNFPLPDYTLKYNDLEDNINHNTRLNLNLDFIRKDDEILLFFAEIIPYCIPSIYLENFNQLKVLSKKSALPQNPKIIFSGVAHWLDEVFKYWAAERIDKGSLLNIIQHGGEYGSPLYNCGPVHEFKIASKFLSWGSLNKENNNRTISIPFLDNSEIDNWSEEGDVIIILASLKSSPYLSDMCTNTLFGEKCEIYATWVLDFLRYLPQRIHPKYKLRFFPESIADKSKLKEILNLVIKMNMGISQSKYFKTELKNASLCVFTYEGTPFSESMARNIPSLLIISEKLNPISEISLEIFKELEAAKILHWDAKSLYKHLEEINSDIKTWWNSGLVAQARNSYCKAFANQKATIYKDIKEIIEEQII